MNRRFWLTLLWDIADTFLPNICEWIAALAGVCALLLILRLV